MPGRTPLGKDVVLDMLVRMPVVFYPDGGSTMITAVVPGLSALGAVLLLGEPLYWNLLLGLALVTVGIVFGVKPVMPVAPAVAATPAGQPATR